MAGNIIPAIATTNAIVAGVQVLQAFKLLRGDTLVAVLPSDLTEAQKYVILIIVGETTHSNNCVSVMENNRRGDRITELCIQNAQKLTFRFECTDSIETSTATNMSSVDCFDLLDFI